MDFKTYTRYWAAEPWNLETPEDWKIDACTGCTHVLRADDESPCAECYAEVFALQPTNYEKGREDE